MRVSGRYTSGDVRLWDTLHWDCAASYLRPRSLACSAAPRPQVTLVQVNRTLAAAAYLDGQSDRTNTNNTLTP